MLIGFRADASIQIGTGHVMRCLTLADALRERGVQTLFFCRSQLGNLIGIIRQHHHEVVVLPDLSQMCEPPAGGRIYEAWLGTDWATDAAATCAAIGPLVLDWLVVDHYSLDIHWEQALRSHCKHLMVIDDLADRLHDCDVLLDQNLGRSGDDYRSLVSKRTKLLTGPQFALLRPEFARLRPESLERRLNPILKQLLITMGGTDKDNATGKVLNALQRCQLPEDLHITVVMGSKAPWLAHVRAQAALMRWPVQVLAGVSDMARLMVESDLAIGASGGTAWERCCIGLPSLVLVVADNQMPGAVALQNIGASFVIEHVHGIETILNKLCTSADKQECLIRLSQSAAQVTDGNGVVRICEELMLDHG